MIITTIFIAIFYVSSIVCAFRLGEGVTLQGLYDSAPTKVTITRGHLDGFKRKVIGWLILALGSGAIALIGMRWMILSGQ